MDICNKEYAGLTFIQLCYVSPDWRINRSKKLRDVLAKQVACVLFIDEEKVADSFCWVKDSGGNKCLLVFVLAIPEDKRTKELFDYALAYAHGLADGMGYI